MTIEKTTRSRRGRRIAWACLACFLPPVLVVVALLGALLWRPVDAPQWIKTRIETQIAQAVPEIALDFSTMRLRVDTKAQLHVTIWDTRVALADGTPIVELSDVEAALPLSDLVRGQLAVSTLNVSGAFLTLARQPDGTIGLALGASPMAGGPTPDLRSLIGLADQALADPRLSKLQAFNADALTVRFEDLRALRGWTLDGGRLRLRRVDDVLDLYGDLALLGGGDEAATIELNAESRIGSDAVDFGLILTQLSARDIATQSPALAWLGALNGQISGALRSGLREDGTLGPLSATLQIGAGALAPTAATRPLPFDSARTYFTFDPSASTLQFDEISVRSPLGEASAEGTVRLALGADGWLEAISGQLAINRVSTMAGVAGPAPVLVEGADAAFKLSLDPFHVELGTLRLRDRDLPVSASGDLQATPDGWRLAVDMQAAMLAADRVLEHWPEAVAPRTRDWVDRNIEGGMLDTVRLALRAEPGGKPMLHTDLRFSDMTVRYNRFLPKLTGAEGRLTITQDRLAARLDAGVVTPDGGGQITMAGSTFAIPDTKAKPRLGMLDLSAQGSVPDALRFIDNDRWRLLQRVGRSPDMADGRVRLGGSVRFPMKPGNTLADVAIDLRGTATDVLSNTLVPDRLLTADTLDVSINDAGFALVGPVVLDGVPATAQWRQTFDGVPPRLTADVPLTPELVARFAPDVPPGLIGGAGRAQLDVAFGLDGGPRFALESDLQGLSLDLDMIDWRLGTAQQGVFALSGALDAAAGSVRIDQLSLEAPGLLAEGHPGGAAGELVLDRVRIGDWLDASASLGPEGLVLSSGQLDLSGGVPVSAATGGGGGPGTAARVRLDELRVTDTIVLRDFEGSFDARDGFAGDFTARVGGRAPVAGTIRPRDNGRWRLRLRGNDAGAILEAAGLGAALDDGDFDLILRPPSGGASGLDGALHIKDSRLRGAPGIATVLDAISIVGVLDQLNGPGIYFDDIEAEFRLSGETVTVSEATAIGPSMAVSLDGFVDLENDSLDMQGVLSPLYIVNSIGRIMAPKGEGLIGVTFTLLGPRTGPQVSVNPLSAFAPGFLRDIFRRPPPDLSP